LTLAGEYAPRFLDAALQGKLSFLPKIRTFAVDLLRRESRVCVQCPGSQGSPGRPYEFRVMNVVTYSSFEEMFNNIPFETVVPWEDSPGGAIAVCNMLPNASKIAEVGGVAAISLVRC